MQLALRVVNNMEKRVTEKARGLLWEFVGGKVELGETKEQALIRECWEELAATISVGSVFMEVDHEYPDLNVHLTLFNAAISEGIPQMLEHNDIRWITPEEIPQYDFCPADEEILRKLKSYSIGQTDITGKYAGCPTLEGCLPVDPGLCDRGPVSGLHGGQCGDSDRLLEDRQVDF